MGNVILRVLNVYRNKMRKCSKKKDNLELGEINYLCGFYYNHQID